MTMEKQASILSTQDQTQLQYLSDLSHLFNHRNHNQHRRSVWWRHFSTFRKQLTLLARAYKSLGETPTTHVARIKKKEVDLQIVKTSEKRIEFWRSVLIPKWQHAFSQVVADGRFAVLGLVLVAMLAQLSHITGITQAYDELGQAEVEKVLEQFGREDWEGEISAVTHLPTLTDDLGEVVEREPVSGSEGVPSVAATQRQTRAGPSKISQIEKSRKRKATPIDKPARKKRSKGNAIDDLFSGLG